MAECGNMPDWHPYSGVQGVRGTPGQNPQNPSHMFISSISPGSLDGMNLSGDSRHQSSKHHQSSGGGGGGGGGGGDSSSYMSRNYPPVPLAPSNCPTSSSLASGVHMSGLSNCVSHYSASQPRNSMIDSSMDPRMVSAMSEDPHRAAQIPFPVPAPHQPSGIGVNPATALHGGSTIPPQNSPVGSMSPGRQAAFSGCKAPCCNPDATLPYQHWEKYNNYHSTTTNTNPYRENLRQSAYPVDNRRYISDMNIRKDCLETSKDLEVPAPFPLDHRRSNFPDYKYRKDSVLPRNYPANAANLLQNYPMQNYNFPGDYQKCPYSVKDYMRRGNTSASISAKSSSHFKYQEQQIAQQKYQKQMQYQNGMTPLQNSAPATSSVASSLQNSYYNPPQVPREIARDYSRDYQQEQNRIAQASSSSAHPHGSFQKYQQVYHQKIAMQRYSVENHLRAFSRIPGYQTHPKYQECVMRYRELLRLQQSVEYQNVLQEAPKIPSPSNAHAPINLQFDQNGVLINTSYMAPGYAGIHGAPNPVQNSENSDNSGNSRIPTNLEARNTFTEQTESVIKTTREAERTHHNVPPPNQENPERFFMPGDKNPDANATLLDSIGVKEANKTNERQEIPTSTAVSGETEDNVEYNNSKDFADKPELDVRQFLANWDESEDEESAATNLAEAANSASGEFAAFQNSAEKNGPQDNCDERRNKEESPHLTSAETVNATEATNEGETSRLNTEKQTETLPKEIECVRSEEDDIPTIHIVDSLEEGSEMEKIHTVFGSLASAVLNPIAIGENPADDLGKGETIVLFEQGDGICAKALEFSVEPQGTASEVVEGVIASIIDSSAVETPEPTQAKEYKSPKAQEADNNEQESEPSISPASSSPDSTFTTTNSVASSTSTSSKTNEEASSLRKQSSFNIDESHNPDDISLPDLQTSECTPISTTLNTPIHSDSEESSEHVTDLTISTNPIEIIQNSPIISFTHSPIKIEPYEHLENARIAREDRQREPESLDFDFDRECARRENEKYNETQTETSVEGLERNSGDSMLLEDIRENYEPKNSNERRAETSFYGQNEPLVGITEIPGDKETKTGNAESASPVEAINDQEILQRERDFRRTEELEKLCDMSLDGSCMIPLIPEEEEDCEEPRMPVPPMEGNCLTKILNDTLPITDLNVLESSDEEKLEKPEDDVWGDVRYMETDLDGDSGEKIKSDARKIRKERRKREKSSTQTEKIDQTRTPSTSLGSEADGRASSPGREISDEDFSSQEPITSNAKEQKKEPCEESRKSKDSRRRRTSKEEKNTLDRFEEDKMAEGRSDEGSSSLNVMEKNQKEDYFEEPRKSKDSRRRRLFTEDELEDDRIADERSGRDANFSSPETPKMIEREQKEHHFKESRKSKDSRNRRVSREDDLEYDKMADGRDAYQNFASVETPKSVAKNQKDDYFEESRKSKDSRRRRLFTEDELEYNKMADERNDWHENFSSAETSNLMAKEQSEDYYEESRKMKDSRRRRISREDNFEYNKMADRSDEDEHFALAETSRPISKEQNEDYYEESRKLKDLRRRRFSREDELDYNKMAAGRRDEDEHFALAEGSKPIAIEQKEDYYEESRKLKDLRRRRVSRDDELDYNKMAGGRSDKDLNFASAETTKSIAIEQKENYYEESRELKDSRRRKTSREDNLEYNKMVGERRHGYENFASVEMSESVAKGQKEDYFEESKKSKDLRSRRTSREDKFEYNKMADDRSDEDEHFSLVETSKSIPKEQKEDHFEELRKLKDLHRRRTSKDIFEHNKMADERSDRHGNFSLGETSTSTTKERKEDYFEEARKLKDLRRRRTSKEDNFEHNKMADERSGRDENFTVAEMSKSITKEQREDYFEESKKSKDSRGRRVSREDELEYNKMADGRSDEDANFASADTSKPIAKDKKESYFEESRKSKDSRRRRVSREEEFEYNKMADGRSDEDANFASTETLKPIAEDQREDYYEESRKVKDLRRCRVSREDEFEYNKMADGRSDEDANFASTETLKPIAEDQREDYYEESRKVKDLRKCRVSREDGFEYNKMADGRSDEDANFASTDTLKPIAEDQREDYYEESRKLKDLRRCRVSREEDLEYNKMADGRSDEDVNFASTETLKPIAKDQKEDYYEESRKLKDLRRRRVSREEDLEYTKMADGRSDEDANFASTDTLKPIAEDQREDYYEESRKLKDLRRRKVSREEDLEYNKMADEKSDKDANFASTETLKPIAKDQKEDYYDESRKLKDLRRRRVSREEDHLEYNKMVDGWSDEDANFAATETLKPIAKDQREDYYEESRKLKDLRRRKVSREEDLEYNKMADGKSDEDANFASTETLKPIAKDQKEDYYDESRKLKDLRRRRVSREEDLEYNKMADGWSDEDANFASTETLKPIANDQKEDYYEPRKLNDLRRRRLSKEDKQALAECDDDKMADSKTTTFLSKHRDSNVEIHVANVNLKIQDNDITRKKDCALMKSNKSQDSSDSVDAIEIKINFPRGDVRRGGKFVEEDRLESLELLEANNQRENWAPRKKFCRKRRRSLPKGFESAKRARKNEEQQFAYTAKKIKSRNRHKARKSMDDELLINYERLRKENIAEDRNFHLEMAKTFNLPWPRDKEEENENPESVKTKTVEEGKKISRNDKQNGRTIPSPSYNSSVDSTMDFDKFDVAPHHSSDTEPEQPEVINETRYGKRKMRLEDRERFRNPTNYGNTDELASLDAFELNLNTVPIYTTKDGRITYSPNRNYTFRALIMEARQREGYPPIRKLHYPSKQLIRSQRREATNQRRPYKTWREDERTDTKRQTGKPQRSHLEENRTRTKTHDNRRKDRINSEIEYASDEHSRNYPAECSAATNRTPDFISGPSKVETAVNQREIEPSSRRNDILRVEEKDTKNSTTAFKGGGKIVDLDDFGCAGDENTAKSFAGPEDAESIATKIFQGQELEISGKPERSSETARNSRFFRDSRLWLKTPMASPLVNLEKRLGWDIEQDCQTLLSDSGLESSTTYVEASKDSNRRIIQRWANNSFGDKVEICRSNEYENVEQEKQQERFLENETERMIEREATKIDENPPEDIPEVPEEKIDEEVTTEPKISLELGNSTDNRMSEIVKSLDLAIVNRNPFRDRSKIEERVNEVIPSKVFRDGDILLSKASEAPKRRASSDDAESRGSRNLFFRETRIEPIEETTEEPAPFLENEEETIDNQDTRTTQNEALNLSKSPEPFQNACKDFLIDTSTSFSSCLRLRVPEPLSDLPTESEASQLEDTATRFASESMDFKEIRESDNSAHEANCRDSFLSTITENAVASDDCSRKSGETRKDSNSSRSSPEKAPILSFSGQIRDSRHEDSISKSPPCLISEDSLPKITNQSRKSSPQRSPKICAEDVHKKTPEFEDSASSQPKLPKMIIRNVRSRPATPTIEETQENTKESKLFEVEMQTEEKIDDCKVPKMKIKLEEKPKIREQETIAEASKNVPRVKIKKVRRSSTSRSPIRTEKLPLVGKLSRQASETEITVDANENMDNSNASSSYKFTLVEKTPGKCGEKLEEDSKQDRIPKLTIKKQEVTGSGGSSVTTAKKRQSRSPGESGSRKKKSTSRHSSLKKEDTRSQERRTNSLDNESNTDSQSLSEKVPKVIIKRTSPSAEFKCELSKEGRDAITRDSKWQPEVKLQRSWVLDCMAKEPGGVKVALKMLEGVMERKERMQLMLKRSRDCKGSKSDCDIDKRPKMSESLGTGNNRRKSFEEFVTNYRRQSRAKAEKKQKIFMDSIKIEAVARKSEVPKENSDKKPENVDKSSRNFDENSGEVIKLDSSDESQTTIEILPASMDNSQTEMESIIMADGNLGKLYSDEAIPTQFELELEIVDNSTVDSLDVPIPLPSDTSLGDDSTSTIDNVQRMERFNPSMINDDDGSIATDLGCEKFSYVEDSVGNAERNHEANICCSDSLVKEVLAAKETLKRCFIRSQSVSRTKLKPRTKTAAEKKQGFHFVSVATSGQSSNCERVFQEEGKGGGTENSGNGDKSSRNKVKDEKNCSKEKQEKYRKSWGDKRTKGDSNSGKSSRRSGPSSSSSSSGSSKNLGKSNYGENSKSKNDDKSKHRSSGKSTDKNEGNTSKAGKIEDSSAGIMKSYKIPKISKSRENDPTIKQEVRASPSPTKIMPVLEPQVQLDLFEIAGSDRDTSRSPPVITKHEERDTHNNAILPKKIEDNPHQKDQIDSINKQENEAVTFADIVSQLAYHEKATIRHRRYCTLCERWFPTAARHRRHLTGYQHRHTELTQRRTVHALFMLFTGKPCPRLLPASIVRTDCLPGEPTPLQIAVQDVAISLEDGARLKPKEVISEKDD